MGTTGRRLIGGVVVVALSLPLLPAAASRQGDEQQVVATSIQIGKWLTPPPACTGPAALITSFFARDECGTGVFALLDYEGDRAVEARFYRSGDAEAFHETPVFQQPRDQVNNRYRFAIEPTETWPAGEITFKIWVQGQEIPAGRGVFFHNFLGSDLRPVDRPKEYRPGERVPMFGTLYQVRSQAASPTVRVPVEGRFFLRVRLPNGRMRGPFGPYKADDGGAGQISIKLPAAATAGISTSAESSYQAVIAVEVTDTSFEDPETGAWGSSVARIVPVTLFAPPKTLALENTYVSPTGWVTPGERYPFRIAVKNFTRAIALDAKVVVPPVPGMSFKSAVPGHGSGRARIERGRIVWAVGRVGARTKAGPVTKTLIISAKAEPLARDPEIVWKNLSTTAALTYRGGPTIRSTSRGPKVVPKDKSFKPARYGFRPFPVVPVDYFDRKHQPARTAAMLAAVINSKALKGSTFNLYQEMSYGQLFPHGRVPSVGVATAGFDVKWKSKRRRNQGFTFTRLDPEGACHGATHHDLAGTEIYRERIRDGWYQLPGNTDYYGDDETARGYGAYTGQYVGSIDNACGSTQKAVYDAAAIADPDIDYSDYDTDKDGVVDFFMMVFAGVGGNGVSQTQTVPYDNIWPHSSSLEFAYRDARTGQRGYISDDQLKDHRGKLLYYTSRTRKKMTVRRTAFPVRVRVGPYNVNPESAIDQASVISHEYGHSLGLPDFYSSGGRSTYGDWNLMATDKSQHMDVFAKQELGWIVPRVLPKGTTTIRGWRDSKVNTHRVDWVRPNGTPYTLMGPAVDNGEAYVARLPSKLVLSMKKLKDASPRHAWWSRAGDGFGCSPDRGRNLDLYLPELEKVRPGTPVRLTFKSNWDIEWDFDYGFVMYSIDGGKSHTTVPSEKGYTTTSNPYSMACQARYRNGLTGSTGSFTAGTQESDRQNYVYPEGSFVSDSYDLSDAAGEETVLRFSYSTDGYVTRPGWFIDDVKVTAGKRVIYRADFESGTGGARVFNGGCRDDIRTAPECTIGWQYAEAGLRTSNDHSYYLELRDRSGFDFDGHGQNSRAPIAFLPGLLLVYTDEDLGYGNVGAPDPPPQSPLDSQPEPGVRTPNLADAAFTDAPGDNSFSDSGKGHVDNYTDPAAPDGKWHFTWDCLSFEVLSMSGEGIGPRRVPGDLRADVRVTIGPGCTGFDYGYGPLR